MCRSSLRVARQRYSLPNRISFGHNRVNACIGLFASVENSLLECGHKPTTYNRRGAANNGD